MQPHSHPAGCVATQVPVLVSAPGLFSLNTRSLLPPIQVSVDTNAYLRPLRLLTAASAGAQTNVIRPSLPCRTSGCQNRLQNSISSLSKVPLSPILSPLFFPRTLVRTSGMPSYCRRVLLLSRCLLPYSRSLLTYSFVRASGPPTRVSPLWAGTRSSARKGWQQGK